MAGAVAIGPHSPAARSGIWTASSTARSSCGLIENPDARVSTSCPSGVTAILPPTVGTRLTQTRISMNLAPDPLIRRVKQRGGARHRDRDRVPLAHILHQQRA